MIRSYHSHKAKIITLVKHTYLLTLHKDQHCPHICYSVTECESKIQNMLCCSSLHTTVTMQMDPLPLSKINLILGR